MEFPDDATGDVLRSMLADNFDFSTEVVIDFFAVFPNETAADSVAQQYMDEHDAGDELENVDTRVTDEGEVEVVVGKKMMPTYDNISAFEQKLAERAAEVGGEDDGWGVLEED